MVDGSRDWRSGFFYLSPKKHVEQWPFSLLFRAIRFTYFWGSGRAKIVTTVGIYSLIPTLTGRQLRASAAESHAEAPTLPFCFAGLLLRNLQSVTRIWVYGKLQGFQIYINPM